MLFARLAGLTLNCPFYDLVAARFLCETSDDLGRVCSSASVLE